MTISVRAPGRVNLIGEHTDHAMLPVLPMAIAESIEVIASNGPPGKLRLYSDGFEEAEIDMTSLADLSGWARYVRGVIVVLGERVAGRGAELSLRATLPSTGGLASSSALTVGALLALGRLWELGLSSSELIDLAVAAERTTGVEGGTMDQTVIVMARSGHALRIDFAPPGRRHVPVPTDFRFVVGYSGEPAAKAAGAMEHYNRSVVSCRAAAAVIATHHGLDPGHPPALGRLPRLPVPPDLKDGMTAAQVAARASIDVATLTTLTRHSYSPDSPLAPATAARHVLSEALRVDQAEEALRAGERTVLGRLFDESHESLVTFGVSSTGLDAVVAAANDAGADGARLTGAGFGGWAVAVCSPATVSSVMRAMEDARGGPAFEVTPGDGAG